jgi:hypothetical protein
MATGTGGNASKLVNYVVLGPPGGSAASKVVNYVVLSDSMASVSKLVNYVVLAPPPSGPIRYKKVALAADFATTTFDQANRIALYEICRLCGFDVFSDGMGNMAALAAFLVAQFPELAGTRWKPPVTLTLEVWSEAVDASWNILKSPDPTGENSKAFCGRRITIDSTVSQEWAGDYEIMEATYTPFQSDASASAQSAGIAQSPDRNAGFITLVLRTYDERWLSIDTSMTPSYVNMPTDIAGDELSYTGT